MNTHSIREMLLADGKPEVLVVGDVILDKFIWGQVERISPEAPVQVVNVQRENVALGGAANVAHNLAALGCRVTLLGVCGNDEPAANLRKALKDARIATDALFTDPSRPTTIKTRILAGSQHVVRIDHETTAPVAEAAQERIVSFLKKNIKRFSVIVVSDYQKGVLTDTILSATLEYAKKHDVKTIVDPKRKDLSIYAGATVIKPNLKEAEAATGKKIRSADETAAAAREIHSLCRSDAVLITRGKEGMLLYEGNKHRSIPATAREVFDVTGAGDTVSAFLAMMLAKGASLEDAAYTANLAAGVAVSRMGTVTVSKEDVLHQLEESTGGARKILTARELTALLPTLRLKRTIVFTNGCFDILHVGHITLLNKSRVLGDKLIVGLNSDSSIRRIKGEKRPIVSEQERAHILSALESVDYVVLFDEDTPLELIRMIRPDILVKGSDYKVEQVVGHDVVASYGGKVALVDLVPGFSTTNIVEAILKSHDGKSPADKRMKKAASTLARIESLQDRFEKKIRKKEK